MAEVKRRLLHILFWVVLAAAAAIAFYLRGRGCCAALVEFTSGYDLEDGSASMPSALRVIRRGETLDNV